MIRFISAFLFALTCCAHAQQLTLTPAGSLPLDGNGYTILPTPSVGGVGNTGSCAAKNYKDALGNYLTCFIKVNANVAIGNDSTCASYSTYSDDDTVNIPCLTIVHAATLLPSVGGVVVHMPSWLLLKKGETFKDQYISVCWSGVSKTSPFVVTAYPLNATGARPIVESPTMQDGIFGLGGCTNAWDYIMTTGIHFYAYTRDPACSGACTFNSAISAGISVASPFHWTLFEDNVFEYYEALNFQVPNVNVVGADTLVFRRNIVLNNYGLPGQAHPACMFISGIINVFLQDNVCDHNGWNATVYNADKTQFNQGLYLDGTASVTGNFFVNGAANALQARGGGFVSDNLVAATPIGLLTGNSPSVVSYNVVTEATNIDFNPIVTTATGTSVLTFGLPLSTQLSAGLLVYDVDNPTFIPSNSVTGTPNLGAGTVPISPAATSTIPIGDHIIFYAQRGGGLVTSSFAVTEIPLTGQGCSGANSLTFASGVPFAQIQGGTTLVVDLTNPSAIPSRAVTVQTGSSTTCAVIDKTLVGTVPLGDIIAFPPPNNDGTPDFGPFNPINLVNNTVLSAATVPTSRTPVTSALYAFQLGALTTGTVNSGNVGCGTPYNSGNLYQDLGIPFTNTPQASAGTFQAGTCAGIGPDPAHATLEAYASSLGLSPTLAALTACFELMSKDNFVNGTFNRACMAHQADNYIRQKLGVPTN